MDDALRRKMQQEFAGIEFTSFWNEYLKVMHGHRRYHTQTLEKASVDRDIAKAQGGISAIDRIEGIPRELTGRNNVPDKDKE